MANNFAKIQSKRFIGIFIAMILVLFFISCTQKLQKAIGCNNPGIFGCKDSGEVSEEAKDTTVLRPATGRDATVQHYINN